MKYLLYAALLLNLGITFADEINIWLPAKSPREYSTKTFEFFDENAHCNPCWMLKRLVEITYKSNDTKSVMEARELIQTKFGPACNQQRKEKADRMYQAFKDDLVLFGKVAAVVTGIFIVGYAVSAIYEKCTSKKTEDLQIKV